MTNTEFEQFEFYCEDKGIRPHGQLGEDLKKHTFHRAKDVMDTLAKELCADIAEILRQEAQHHH